MESNEQQIRFCKSSDGVSIAYASVGDGPPLVKAGVDAQSRRRDRVTVLLLSGFARLTGYE
jgi:hypothetical protein